MIRCILLYAAWLMLLRAYFSAQNAQASPAKEDPQTRAEALLNRARELSDIRSTGSPAFRLRASFSFPGEDLQTVHGTYTEIWLSASQWRRETAIGDLHRIDVGGSGKHWVSFPQGFPQEADQLPYLFAVTPAAREERAFTSVSERTTPEVVADCAYTTPVVENLPSSFCFEKRTGLLIEKTFPEKRPRNLVRHSCDYRTFHKFHDDWFPYDVGCFDDRHKTVTASVEELADESNPDPALFVPPAGAPEIAECAGKVVPPVHIEQVPDALVYGHRRKSVDHVRWIKVWMVVDKKGRPESVTVIRTLGEGSIKSTVDFIRSWNFKPGTCDGQPVPMTQYLELDSAPGR